MSATVVPVVWPPYLVLCRVKRLPVALTGTVTVTTPKCVIIRANSI